MRYRMCAWSRGKGLIGHIGFTSCGQLSNLEIRTTKEGTFNATNLVTLIHYSIVQKRKV